MTGRVRIQHELLSKKEVAEMLRVSLDTLQRWRKVEPDFPPAIRLTGQTLRWRRSDIERFLIQREAA